MSEEKVTTKTIERWVIAICVIGALLCLWGVIDPSLHGFRKIERPQSRLAVVGKIAFLENDTRRKSSAALQWDKAEREEKIHLGDSVFTGAYSRSSVALEDGGSIELGENSLVVFKHLRSIDIPSLDQGNVRLNVKDRMRIAIGGKITEITGHQSELEIVVKKNEKPEIRLISGSAQLRVEKTPVKNSAKPEEASSDAPATPEIVTILPADSGHRSEITFAEEPITLTTNETVHLDLPTEPREAAQAHPAPAEKVTVTTTEDALPQVAEVVVPPPPPEPSLVLKTGDSTFEHVDQLADLYEVQMADPLTASEEGPHYQRREKRSSIVAQTVRLEWEVKDSPGPVQIQTSTTMGFTDNVKSITRQEPWIAFDHAAVGDTYWRLSLDGRNWSEVRKFTVNAHPSEVVPRFKWEAKNGVILDHETLVSAKLTSNSGAGTTYLLEVARSPNFPRNETHVHRYDSGKVKVSFTSAGLYYARLRAVNEKNEISSYSATESIQIEKPERPVTPLMAQTSISILETDLVKLDWNETPGAASYHLRILAADGTILKEKSLTKTNFAWAPGKSGQFRAELSSVDAWDRESARTTAQIEVKAPPLPLAKREDATETKRAPSALELSTKSIETAMSPGGYAASNIQLEMAEFSMYSGEQLIKDGSVPTGFNTTLRGLHWINNDSQGLEGTFTKAVSGNSVTDPMDLEARYLYRWRIHYNPLAARNEFQVVAVAAFEHETNDGSGLYSPRYEVLKTGFMLDIPLLERWVTGGEVLVGGWFDGSQKYEVSGYLNYEFAKHWALGGGYRVHLFQAGSESFAPAGLGLPYREAYGEAFSVLMWRY